MKQQRMAVVLIALIVGFMGGCDSSTVSESSKSEPTVAGEAASSAEGSGEATMEMAKAGTEPMALSASEETAGAGHNNEGVTHYQQSHWDVAQEHFQKAIAENAKLAEAHYNVALTLDKLGNHGEATTHFKTALELGSDIPGIKDSGILQAHVGG
ncbi:MAG: tetratricopeptide repeat protein [Nitrospirae bacterium]|nr:tetratricopeptide repeat protein [Nitrospirota bacterium]MDA1304781.1 tetratricopeptide repeat protein [Nitrospirota bacterium]